MRSGLHRRRSLAAMASANIVRAAARVAAEQDISLDRALTVVFADQDLLSHCHRVAGSAVPDPPVSSVKAQNKA